MRALAPLLRRTAFARFRGGVSSGSAPITGNYVLWFDGEQGQRFVTTRTGDRVIYRVPTDSDSEVV